MAYDGGEVLCWYGKKVPRWISWTDKNPGMQFWYCLHRNQNSKGCGFFEWQDDLIRERARKVIIALRDSEKELERENHKLRSCIAYLRLDKNDKCVTVNGRRAQK